MQLGKISVNSSGIAFLIWTYGCLEWKTGSAPSLPDAEQRAGGSESRRKPEGLERNPIFPNVSHINEPPEFSIKGIVKAHLIGLDASELTGSEDFSGKSQALLVHLVALHLREDSCGMSPRRCFSTLVDFLDFPCSSTPESKYGRF